MAGYNYQTQNVYGGFNPNESQASANQRGGVSGNYDGSSSPYQNSYGQSYYNIDKRTDSCTLFSDSGVMLKCTFVNDALSLSFCLPTIDPATGKPKYPKENKVNTVLTRDRIAAMTDTIEKHFIPKTEAGQHYNFGVWTNKDHNTIVVLTSDAEGDALVVHNGITNASGGIPTKSIRFDFHEDALILENYNPLNGQGDPLVLRVQLFVFCRLLNVAYDASFNAAAQEIKNGMKYEMNKLENDLSTITARLGGIPNDPTNTPAYNQTASTGYYEANRAASTTIPAQTPVPVELNSLDQLPF